MHQRDTATASTKNLAAFKDASPWVPTRIAANVGVQTHAQNQSNQQQNVRFDASNPLYKTELCRSFEEFGQCRYGTKCQFAHSLTELRPVQRHPKYKTEVCKTFATTGTCPYGTRCRFIHQTQTLAQLQTAKAESAKDDVSVYSASMSGMSTPVPMSPHASHAVPQAIGGTAPEANDNPLSFANVAKGAIRINRVGTNGGSMGSLASMARVASGISGISGVPSSNGGSLVGSVVGSPALGNYLDAVKELHRANGVSNGATPAISINGQNGQNGRGSLPEATNSATALAAALDVLAVEDDISDLADSIAGSLPNGGSIFGSLEDRKSFLSGLGNPTELSLDEGILGTSADISGSSLMAHMGSKDRRLPVFSRIRPEDHNDQAEN